MIKAPIKKDKFTSNKEIQEKLQWHKDTTTTVIKLRKELKDFETNAKKYMVENNIHEIGHLNLDFFGSKLFSK